MSGVLHPVGPEPARVYWARRGFVVGGFLVIVAVIIALAVNAAGRPQPVSAVPATSTPAPVPTQMPSVLPTSATPSATMSASGSSPSTAPTSTPTPSSKASDSGKASVSGKPSATPSAKATVARCDPAQLRATLTGNQRLQPKEANTFRLSLINGGLTTCQLNITPATFELKIFSGQDRIWSSTTVRPRSSPSRETWPARSRSTGP